MLLAILQLRKALRTRALPKKYRRASSATEKPATKILRMQMIIMAVRASSAISRKTIIRKMPLNKKAVISVLVALISKNRREPIVPQTSKDDLAKLKVA